MRQCDDTQTKNNKTNDDDGNADDHDVVLSVQYTQYDQKILNPESLRLP